MTIEDGDLMGMPEAHNQKTDFFHNLVKRFIDVRSKTEELCHPLSPEDFVVSVSEDTSPPKWHLAHTTWFYEHFILAQYKKGFESFKPEYNYIFNSYYKSIGDYLPKCKRNILSRPTIEEVFQYRHYVTEAILSFLENHVSQADEVLNILEIGINHEEQHQELLLMDIKRNFFENPLKPHYQTEVILKRDIEEASWRTFHHGLVKVGVQKDSPVFAYDNEKDQHQVWLESFELSSHLVTNDEYLLFMEDGGYRKSQLWLSDGWEIKEKEKWDCPLYWEKIGGEWWNMTFSGLSPLELSAPVVHVSYYEAAAFAKWRKCRLPREEEWETAASLEKKNGEFLNQSNKEPNPSNERHEVFSQIHGTVWEWTQSFYQAYARFEPTRYGMNEYNEKFMVNQMVMRGGSCITPESHYRVTYRNFFYPHQRWMFGGIRLAKDAI